MELKDNNLMIRYVALYLRKSRGEIEDLEKHKKVLVEMCVENRWKYVLYEEVETGESIEIRPVVQRLLKDVEDDIFDAVCVIDIDRLGRGDMGDQDKIKKSFIKGNTLVVTPQQIYNLQNDDDEFVVDMKGFIARREYKQIVKRLSQGKKVGARMGQWTNGTPPFPYEYQYYKDKFNEKGIVINDEKLIIYRRIIDSLLVRGLTTSEIAWELNKDKQLSPRGKVWSNVAIYRLLIDETHLGKIITNKTVGDAHKKKKSSSKEYKILPKTEWVIVENCHQPAKTIEEHERILIILTERGSILKRSTAKKLPLTGLIKCAKCGHTIMMFNRKGYELLKPCWYKDEYGNKCGNKGSVSHLIYPQIELRLDSFEEELLSNVEEDNNFYLEELNNNISIKKREIIKKERALEKAKEAYESDVYSLAEFKERKTKLVRDIEQFNEEIQVLELKSKYNKRNDNIERLERIKQFRLLMKSKDKLNSESLNKAYKEIIDYIQWYKDENEIVMNVVFK